MARHGSKSVSTSPLFSLQLLDTFLFFFFIFSSFLYFILELGFSKFLFIHYYNNGQHVEVGACACSGFNGCWGCCATTSTSTWGTGTWRTWTSWTSWSCGSSSTSFTSDRGDGDVYFVYGD